MTTAGLEPATFWCRQRSKPNALPLRQVAIPIFSSSILYSDIVHWIVLKYCAQRFDTFGKLSNLDEMTSSHDVRMSCEVREEEYLMHDAYYTPT
ncbi:hypothetical protein ABKN59_005642 [Abortiporus biennis]